jgi:hypothetical protein
MEEELPAAPLADEPPPPICGWVGDERVGRTCCHGEDYRRRRHEKPELQLPWQVDKLLYGKRGNHIY